MPPKPVATEDIFDALIDDESLDRLPGLLAEAFGGQSAIIQWLHPGDDVDILAQCGSFSNEQLARYAEFAVHDPWAIAAARENITNQAMSLEELVPSTEFANTFFYNEFLRPMGIDTFRCLGTRVANQWGTGMVAIHRGRGQCSFDRDGVAGLDLHIVALRRMLAVRGRLASRGRRAASLEAMLDHVGQAAMVVRADGMLLHTNAAGERLLCRADALYVRHGLLSARSGDSASRLKRAIGRACAPDGVEASALLVDRAAARPLAISVVPFRAAGWRRDALVIAQDMAGTGDGVANSLRALYRLTHAEAEIARRIADGLGSAQIAEERCASIETVRSQMKALKAKLGCSRQSEIAALVRGLPAAHSAGSGSPNRG
ncbi:MAG TPA: helix-turn-helix transcriptional regulator [Allosphingosinicella sp.]